VRLVERGQVLAQLCQIEEPSDAAEQVIRRNVRVEVEGIEPSVLVAAALSHDAVACSVPASP
jgi:hypothetical protein